MERKCEYTELQLKHQQQMKEKRNAIKERKIRTHRLIVRGAMAENVIAGASGMTDEQFQQALYDAVGKGAVKSYPQDSNGSFPRKSLPEGSCGSNPR